MIPRGRRSGFTLAETLLATALGATGAAVAAIALAAAFRALAGFAARGAESGDVASRLAALETLRMDLACALPPPFARFESSGDGFACERLLSAGGPEGPFFVAEVEWKRGPGGEAVRSWREKSPSGGEKPRGASLAYRGQWGAPRFEWISGTNAPPRQSGGAPFPVAAEVKWAGTETAFRVMAAPAGAEAE